MKNSFAPLLFSTLATNTSPITNKLLFCAHEKIKQVFVEIVNI